MDKYAYLKNLDQLEKDLEKKRAVIEGKLKEYLPQENTYPPLVHQAMRYAVLPGGKRIRPLLAMLSAELFGPVDEAVLAGACAIEVIHSYSLIHDDLPAMDDDDLRRGRPTTHKAFGEAIAILAGDALNTLAFGILARGVGDAVKCKKMVKELACGAGSVGMIGGQSIDILSEGRQADERTLEYINLHKTGALMRGACVLGAIAAGAGDENAELLGNFGSNLGMSFQIMDDVLDAEKLWATASRTRTKHSKEIDKMTYVALLGPERSRDIAAKYNKQAVSSLVSFQKEAAKLVIFAQYLLNRET